jgi:hypothetical protein
MARGRREISVRTQPALGLPGILSQYEAVLRLRDFATESDSARPRWLGLTRRGIWYTFTVAEDDDADVRFGVTVRALHDPRGELSGLMIGAAAAVMSAFPFARILILPGGDVSVHVDALVSSPDHLGRCVDKWANSIRDAVDTFISTVNEFSEPPKKRKASVSKKAAPRPVAPDTATVFRLKVRLRDVRPPIWRRIEVPGNVTFAKLHHILQAAMGWTDSHLHEFIVGGRHIGRPGDDFGGDVENEARVRLEEVAAAKSKLTYWYDFGDDWWHDITVERVGPREAGVEYPRLLAGERSAPPEDVGGVGGYEEFLEAVADPKHPERDAYLTWVGGAFDPEAFDLASRQRLVRKIR